MKLFKTTVQRKRAKLRIGIFSAPLQRSVVHEQVLSSACRLKQSLESKS
jgi:hypothetical protein